MFKATQRIRVEWAHCDPAGIIFNPNYYIWMDGGTHQLMHAAGFDMAEAVKTTDFRGCALVTSSATFRQPVYYNDVLTLTTQVERFGGRSFTMTHGFHRGEELVAEGAEVRVWAWTHPDKPEGIEAVAVPDEVRAILSIDKRVDTTP